VQNIGRGLRASPGKQDLLILDHSTTTARLGFVDEIYAYHPELDDGKTKPKAEIVLLPKMCPACHLMKPPRCAVCPHCGHDAKVHADPIPVERGTLREVKPTDEVADWRKKLPDKAHVFGQLWWFGQKKGYKSGWAAVKTKEIFGSFPRDREPAADLIGAPVPELIAYIYYSKDKWVNEQNKIRRRAKYKQERETQWDRANGNGHANGHGNGHNNGALTDREQAIIDRVAERTTLMTEDDYRELDNFK
jgi:hypothetical protein